MAPTKNVSDLAQKVVKKKLVKAKPTKPSLKIPKCITVKIVKLGSKPPRITRKVSSQEKIELANEVAMNQLTKPSETQTQPSPIAKATPLAKKPVNTPKSKTKPIVNRKRKSPNQPSDESGSDNIPLAKKVSKAKEESAAKPKRKRNQVPKTPLKTPFKEISESEPESVSLIKPVSVTRAKKTVKKKEQKPKDLCHNHTNGKTVNPEGVPETPVKRIYKKKQTPKKPETTTETKGPIVNEKATKKRGRSFKEIELAKQTNGKPNLKVARGKKGKGMNAKEIETAASILENALKRNAAQVHSRSSSINSLASNLSWTKDISSLSSGTTTCVTVTSNDFVRFDKKLPYIQIENLDRPKAPEKSIEHTFMESLSSSSSDSKSRSTSSSESNGTSTVRDLNLSTSSLTTASVHPDSSLNYTELMCLELDKMNEFLNQFYSEISKLASLKRDNDDFNTFHNITEAESGQRSFVDSIKNYLDPIKCKKTSLGIRCPQQNRELIYRKEIEYSRKNCENSSPGQRATQETYEKDSDEEFYEPGGSTTTSVKIRDTYPKNDPPTFAIQTTPQKNLSGKSPSACSEQTFTSDNCKYTSFENRVCDDEDTLSLFAESISGMESSRLSSVVSVQEPYAQKPTPSLQEAYIPKPMKPLIAERYTYRPTRINDQLQTNAEEVPLKTIQPIIIEKQNADSSSIPKETNKKTVDNYSEERSNYNSTFVECSATSNGATKQPQLIFSQYQQANAVKSFLYKGYCFFYLSKQCFKVNCRFPHTDIEPSTLKCRLSILSEDNLIEEYLLTCQYPNLRRKYCLLIMQEFKKREATRILIEMAIELGLGVVEREDSNLMTDALEIALLHLNRINFDACDDLLLFTYNGRALCDSLLLCMAYSQNFAQFKNAFVKLANFMAQIKRPVDIETAGNILERVCILPCEESLARGMLCLMKNTDPSIFDNAMINSFETQLTNIEGDVHIQYLLAKREAIEAQLAKTSYSADRDKGGPRHPSPDTTNLDSLKKAQVTPQTIFKRTIDTEAIRHLFKSPSNPAPKQRYISKTQWHRGVGYKMRSRPHNRMLIGRKMSMSSTYYRNGSNK